MRTYDFAPLYRSTVGFDRLLDMIDSAGARPDWPPYDIENKGDNEYRITMAIAGFKQDEIELTQHSINLHVSGQKAQPAERQMLHQGIAGRSFKQTFSLADHVKVAGATLEDGLLTIDLVCEIPEQLKPRRIDIIGKNIVSNSVELSAQDNQPKQIDDTAPRKVA